MPHATTFASIIDDHGPASELVHVSPIFTRCGPCTRGRYADRREARTWRTDARHARRSTEDTNDIRFAVEVDLTETTERQYGSGERRDGRC